MKKLLASTALVALTALPLAAQTTAPAAGTAPAQADTAGGASFAYTPADGEATLHASNFIGKRVYVSEAEIDAATAIADADADWDDVGEIKDVLMNREGQAEAILVDVGGFLGIGEKTVAVSMDQLDLIPDSDGDASDYFVAFTASKDALQNAPAYVEPEEAADKQASATATTTTTAAATTTAATGTDAAATPPAASTDTAAATDTKASTDAAVTADASKEATPVDPTTVTAEQLQGAPVYDSNDEKVGDIKDVVVADDGTITHTVVDLGGFLGIGAKPVAFDFGQLKLSADDADGKNLSVHVSQTEDEMKAMPEYTADKG